MEELYNSILIDIFNVYHRLKNNRKSIKVKELATVIINYINDIKKHLTQDGTLYLLYDAIPKSDLNIFKSFTFNTDFEEKQTDRQRIKEEYKKGRKKDKMLYPVIFFVKSYFLHRGSGVVSVMSENLEADDYVESIVKNSGKTALVSTDEDWCRYLNDRIVMINEGFDKPFTAQAFFEKYKFTPTIGSVSLFKALFGDTSDNITGVCSTKYGKILTAIIDNFKDITFNYIKEISENPTLDIDSYIDRLLQLNFKTVKTDEHQAEKIFFEEIFKNESFTKIDFISELVKNLKVIKSRCKNFRKYASSKEFDEVQNRIIESALNMTSPYVKKPFSFGMYN